MNLHHPLEVSFTSKVRERHDQRLHKREFWWFRRAYGAVWLHALTSTSCYYYIPMDRTGVRVERGSSYKKLGNNRPEQRTTKYLKQYTIIVCSAEFPLAMNVVEKCLRQCGR